MLAMDLLMNLRAPGSSEPGAFRMIHFTDSVGMN